MDIGVHCLLGFIVTFIMPTQEFIYKYLFMSSGVSHWCSCLVVYLPQDHWFDLEVTVGSELVAVPLADFE